MFDKFGEFDSFEEINKLAENEKNEGDTEAVKNLAEENGLDPEDTKDYLDGYCDTLCTATSAAEGKVRAEIKEYKLKEGTGLYDFAEEVIGYSIKNADFARAVRKKGKSITGYLASVIDYSFTHGYEVPTEIVKQTKKAKTAMGGNNPRLGDTSIKDRIYLMGQYYGVRP